MAKNERIASVGAARRGGTWNFMLQRGSSLALLVLTPWFAFAAPLAARDGYEGLRAFMVQPLHMSAVAILVVVSCVHMNLGLTEVIEDYIHKPFGKYGLITLNALVCLAAAVVGVGALVLLYQGA